MYYSTITVCAINNSHECHMLSDALSMCVAFLLCAPSADAILAAQLEGEAVGGGTTVHTEKKHKIKTEDITFEKDARKFGLLPGQKKGGKDVPYHKTILTTWTHYFMFRKMNVSLERLVSRF